MKIKLSSDVSAEIKQLKLRDPKLAAKAEKQLALFAQNPKHPSLRTHKLTGKIEDRWSISITKSIRMVYVVIEGQEENEEPTAYFVAIGTHDQVYRDKK